jgi:hypothetical protein
LGIVSAGLITVIWSFFLFVPYETIPDAGSFWTAFVTWAVPIALVIWALRNKSPKRISQVFSDVIIVVGIAVISLVLLQNRWSLLHSLTLAAMPGVLTGILVGVNGLLIPRIFRGQIGPGY